MTACGLLSVYVPPMITDRVAKVMERVKVTLGRSRDIKENNYNNI